MPVSSYTLANLRKQLAMVSQPVTLFHDTVYNNIAYGSLSDADEKSVLAAVASACAREFIDSFAAGYSHPAGR